jgi:hypothetical protein
MLDTPQARLDALESGKRFISPPWKDWGDVEEGGPVKASRTLLAA